MRFIKVLQQVREIRNNINNIPDSFSGNLTREQWQENFKSIWDVIIPALSLVKLVTPDRVDKIIDELVIVGNEVASGGASENQKSVFIEKFSMVWVEVRSALFHAMKFTGERVDSVIEKIIAWGDLISEQKPVE